MQSYKVVTPEGKNVYTLQRVSRPRNFFQKNKRWFDFAAAIVVAGTFLINEGLKNRAKESADSIEKAQSSFSTRTEIEAIAKRLLEVQEQLTGINSILNARHDPISSPRPDPSDEGVEDMDVLEARVEYPAYVQTISVFDNAMRLYRTLPYDQKLDETHWRLTREMELMQSFTNDAFEMSLDDNTGKAKEAAALKLRIAETRNQMTKVRAGLETSVPAELDAFGVAVLRRAEEIHDEEERQATIWKYVSYGLYPIGFILGLFGKLYGGETDSEAPE